MATPAEDVEIARFYTRSRRFPKMIGRMHDGTKIRGGPYTVTQATIGGVLFLLAVTTRAHWGTGSILVDFPISIGIAWGAAWVAGRIPSTRRNLLSVLLGGLSAMSRPSAGTYRGSPLRFSAPHAATGRVDIGLATPELGTVSHIPSPASYPAPIEPTSARLPAATTAVERLLEQTRAK